MRIAAIVIAGVSLCLQPAYSSETLPPDFHSPSQTGVIRIWGHPSLTDIVDRWRETFSEAHPDLRIDVQLSGSDVAMAALTTGRAEVALLARPATAPEVQAFEWVYQYKPAKVDVLTGSYDRPGRAAALVVMVNSANPLTTITLEQLDSAFSYERRRGGTAVKTWGQLGLDGNWADQTINLYSFDTDRGSGRYFREQALDGTRHLNWDRVREFNPEPEHFPYSLADANRRMLDALANDRFGMAVATAGDNPAGVKALALATCTSCEAVRASRKTVGAHQYPLTRTVSAYFNRPPDNGTDTSLAEFLDFVVGPGQAVLAEGVGYLPITESE